MHGTVVLGMELHPMHYTCMEPVEVEEEFPRTVRVEHNFSKVAMTIEVQNVRFSCRVYQNSDILMEVAKMKEGQQINTSPAMTIMAQEVVDVTDARACTTAKVNSFSS